MSVDAPGEGRGDRAASRRRLRAALVPRSAALFGARVLLYVALMLGVLYAIQDRLIYFPDRHDADLLAARAQASGLAPWSRYDAAWRGFVREPRGEARGTVLVFHGNAGNALDRTHYADAIVPLGYRVVLLEYPGYGAREGALGEASFVADGCAALDAAHAQFGPPLLAFGESLGAGVAAAVTGRCPERVHGLALITAWDTLPDLGHTVYPFLPVRLLLRDRYDSIANLRAYPGPVAVLLAERDRVIPPRHARRLFDALPPPKRLWTFPDAGHNDWPAGPGAPWWEEVLGFLGPG